MNKDQLNSLNVRKAANAAMTVIDAIQDMHPAEQLAGITATFLLLADHQGYTAQDMFSITANIMNHADGRRPEFAAAAQYMKEEL